MEKTFANPVRARFLLSAAALLGILLTATCGSAWAEKRLRVPGHNRRSETRVIEGLEEQWRTALVKGDASAMEKLLADDFLAISARGTLSDKQQYLERISNHATQFSTIDLLDLKVRVQPASAVVVSQAHVVGVLEGRHIEGTFRYTKVYERAPSASWRITNFEATRVSVPSANGSDMDRGTPLGSKTPPTTQ